MADEPKRLIGDKAYDSDSLDAALAKRGIEMIAPHRSNRTAPKTQDGRSLRRYKRRWKVERTPPVQQTALWRAVVATLQAAMEG